MTQYHVLQQGFLDGRNPASELSERMTPAYVVIETDIEPAHPMPGLFKVCSVPLSLAIADQRARQWNENGRT